MNNVVQAASTVPALCEERQNDAQDVQQAVMAIRSNLADAFASLQRGELEQALKSLDLAVRRKHELWVRIIPFVNSLARRFAPYTSWRVGMTEDDLVQEAFFKFSKVVARYDAQRGAKFQSWLILVMARFFIQLGRRQRADRTSGDVEAMDCLQLLGLPDDRMGWLAIEDLVDSLLPGDPRRDQKIRVFKRYWFERWTMAELSDQLGVSVGTIHGWLSQVKRAFREAFSDP